MVKRLAKKVLLIGWDGADWKIINPLLDAGRMPALERIVNNGVIANLATLDPPLSPMLWTSIATGKKADKHGIIGFIEPDSVKGGIRPVNVTSRKVNAIWNILHNQGLKSNVVGWWPSHPAEPIDGVMVSNFYQKVNTPYGKPWRMLKNTVHPNELGKELRNLRVHPGELTEAHILPFVPNAGNVDQEKDKRLAMLSKIIADAASIQSASTWLMENTEWDLMAIYFDSIDHFSHGFIKFHPPKMKGVPDDLFDMYKDVVAGGYIFHDMMLERLLKLTADDTTLILISDHGFHSDHLRPLALPKLPAAPALEHSPYGIFCISGPGILKDERIYGATLLDITPTILTLFGLPVGKDMDGKVLTSVFEEPKLPELIESWDKLDGDFGMHPSHKQEDSYASAEAMQQLIELGYVEDPGEDKMKAMKNASNEAQYNLSRVHASNNQYDKAVEILEKLYSINNDDIRYNLDLANYYLELKRFTESGKIVNQLRSLDNKALPNIDLLEGKLLMNQNKPKKALEFLKNAEKSNPRMPGIHLELGKIYLLTTRYQDAQRAFLKALEIDDSSAPAYHGLAISLLRLKKYEEAADQALNAIGLMYHFPSAHYHLGEALFMIERYKESAEAFEVSLTMAPSLIKARRWLLKIYSDHFQNKERQDLHKNYLKEQMKKQIIIVSGLPRSGTSLLMQMLHAGGLEILTDDERKPDENNPNGYFEFQPVKSIRKNKTWIKESEGKAVKVIAQLLRFLPNDYEYKIIFMQRNMYEILQSQQKMLGKKEDVFPLNIANAFEKELEKVDVWTKKEPNVDLIKINFKELINDPFQQAEKIDKFLNFQLDINEMIKVVDPQLYKSKVKN